MQMEFQTYEKLGEKMLDQKMLAAYLVLNVVGWLIIVAPLVLDLKLVNWFPVYVCQSRTS
jgi:hypothetical protein